MKTTVKTFIRGLFILLLTAFSLTSFADDPNPPTVPGDHGHAGDIPLGAPIDGGLSIFLVLGAGYGARKLYRIRKETDTPEAAE